jgi:hypothetical protein
MRTFVVALAVFGWTCPIAAEERWAMPNFLGKTLDEARAIAKAAGFVYAIETRPLDCEDAASDDGKINCQWPEPGSRVDKHALIQVNVYRTPTHPGQLVREELARLVGMTVVEAKRELVRLGHDGEVRVAALTVFVPKCALVRVCAVAPEMGTGVHDPILLGLNPKAEISKPR